MWEIHPIRSCRHILKFSAGYSSFLIRDFYRAGKLGLELREWIPTSRRGEVFADKVRRETGTQGGIVMKAIESMESTAVIEQRNKERRSINERRKPEAKPEFVAEERRVGERRVKVERRRQIDPTTCERDYTDDEVEFMKAMDEYKRRSGRMFPTWSEVLEVVRGLGYHR